VLAIGIPSPSSNSISIGPLELRAYGIAIAFGVIAAVWLAQKRFEKRGHDPEIIASMAMWVVPAGVIGARIYHVVTDNQRFRGNWFEAVKIWEGGLGIWGGVAAGVLTGVWLAKRRGWDIPDLLDAIAPAVPIAQAVGRIGNWFNQELFGGPTSLPWGLEIDERFRPSQYANEPLFHPTFLYEALWNLGVAAIIIWVVPRVLPQLKRGLQFGVYVVLYTLGRVWIELLRVDKATEVFGVRVNVWTSIIVGLSAAGVVVWLQRRSQTEDLDVESDNAASPAG